MPLTRLALALPLAVTAMANAKEAPWSPFAPLDRPEPPAVEDAAWRHNPIDRFVRHRLRGAGLEPAPRVGRRVWLRRVTFDLTGLPPTPEAMRAFLSDSRPDAIACSEVVDRLLASPAHGERWARHWLDVVRYADTDGFAIDGERPTLWRYRDYIIRAFNEDRPFDELIREQIAGDEIRDDAIGHVATGFFRLGPWEADNMVPEVRRQDYLDEITTAVGNAFLGLTLGCARCHDHKYDPIPTRDYYRLQAFLKPLKRKDVEAELAAAELTPAVASERASVRDEHERRVAAHRALREELRAQLAAARDTEEPKAIDDAMLDDALKAGEPFSKEDRERLAKLKKAIDEHEDLARFAPRACSVENPGDGVEVPATHVLLSGEVSSPGDIVQPGFLSALPGGTDELRDELAELQERSRGRRRILARWLVSHARSLTARVLANRIWQYHFGRGIVATSNDFGANGSGASHPRLLDYLASELVRGGWRLKPLHRLLVLSRAYRTASLHPEHDHCARRDPRNRLLWRGPFRRLEAEAIRDAVLEVSGQLSSQRGGPGFLVELPGELGRNFPFFTWEPSPAGERRRRSIYMFQRRNMVPPLFEAFDAADASQSCERRQRSVTTPQVFSLFNGKFAHEAARHFARRLFHEAGDESSRQVELAFRLALGREPSEAESRRCVAFLETAASGTSDELAAEGRREPQALVDLCRVLFNTNEFLYLE